MSLSATVDAMVSAGCTAEQIAAVVRSHEAATEAKLADKRAKDAERKRRSRHAESRGVTRTKCDNADDGSPLPVPPSSFPPYPPTNNPLTPSPLPKITARATRLPDDWRPNNADWAKACDQLGFSAAETELEKMRDWSKSAPASKGVKRDWNAAFRNWIRTAAERRPQQRAGPQSGRSLLARLATGCPSNDLPSTDPTIIELNPRTNGRGGFASGDSSPQSLGEGTVGRLFDFGSAATYR